MIQFINNPFQIDDNKLKSWLLASAVYHHANIEKLIYYFISKEKMHKLNLKYLNHDTHTDILTFPYGNNKNIISEVYISIDQATENASKYSQAIENEILRLISHGFLHSIGFLDDAQDHKQKMTKEEDVMVNMFHVKHYI